MDYQRSITLEIPYSDAVTRTRDALADQGFGVLTEIDVKATLREKLGLGMEPYVILGACNPELAHQALEVDRSVGVLLPCNVVVSGRGEGSTVQILRSADHGFGHWPGRIAAAGRRGIQSPAGRSGQPE